ncbi:MAG TPA: hypothetical protein VEC16_02835 [Alphaproteobacteria bacterium]|nr:hypothetical protein [Alphaproteobacteria bacterium]
MSSCNCANEGCKCNPSENSLNDSKTNTSRRDKRSKIFTYIGIAGIVIAGYGAFQTPKKNPKVNQYYSATKTLESLRNYDLESKKRHESSGNYISTFDMQNIRDDLEHTIYALENDSTELYNSPEVKIYAAKSERSQNIVALGGVLVALAGYGFARILNKKTKELRESK